jgi:hypothetical protein
VVAIPGAAEPVVPGAACESATVGDDLGVVLAVLYGLDELGIRLCSLRRPLRYLCRACGVRLESVVAARCAGPPGGWICPRCFYRHVTGIR